MCCLISLQRLYLLKNKKNLKKLRSHVDFGEMMCFRLLLWKKVDVEQIRIKRLKCTSEN